MPDITANCLSGLGSRLKNSMRSSKLAMPSNCPRMNISIRSRGARRASLACSCPKATAPLLDTPQTITVISDQTLRKQNLLTLRDALQTIPGITGGALDSDEGAPGPILLQGDHGPIEFRVLRLTPAKE